MTRLRALLALGLLALAGVALAAAAADKRVRLPDGRRLYLNCTGHGSPTVLLEGGYRATAGGWFKVQPELARTTRTCSYDRAGYGRSDPGPLPRDGAAAARDLDEALKAAKIGGPYVLVGHSAGALYVRLFSDLRPREVAGMVLVDASVEHQDRRFDAVFGPGSGGNTALRARATTCLEAAQQGRLPSQEPGLKACGGEKAQAPFESSWRTALSELDSLWTSTSDELDRGRQSYGDIPIIALTADGTYAAIKQPEVRDTASALWRQLHREAAARSTRGEERLVERSSHMLMIDRPDAVIEAVQEIVKTARSR